MEGVHKAQSATLKALWPSKNAQRGLTNDAVTASKGVGTAQRTLEAVGDAGKASKGEARKVPGKVAQTAQEAEDGIHTYEV